MHKKLQVFISSTFNDLVEERQAAVIAVLKAGHIPAGMELFTACDQSPMTIIKKWIDESDVYMLILGGRYGSIETTSGISYTEIEYNYALQQKKPVFAVVINDTALEKKLKTCETTFIEKDNPDKLSLFRKKVLSNVSSFFDDLKDIKLYIQESLGDFSINRELKGWVSANEIVDPKPLLAKIEKLSEINRSLRETIRSMKKRPSANIVQVKEIAETQAERPRLARAALAGTPEGVAAQNRCDYINTIRKN